MATGFPLWRTVGIGYTETFRNFGKVLKLAWKPLLVVLVAHCVSAFIGLLSLISQIGTVSSFIVTHALFLVISSCFGIFALSIYRYRLLGWSDETNHVSWKLKKREWKILAVVLAVFLFREALLHSNIWSQQNIPNIHAAMMFIVVLVEVIFLSRLVFTLPAIALDVRKPLEHGWILGKGLCLRLVGLILLTLGIFYLLDQFQRILLRVPLHLFFHAQGYSLSASGFLTDLVLALPSYPILFLGTAIVATAVSDAYKAQSARLEP